ITPPPPSRAPHQLDRSPISRPTVSLSPANFPIPCAAAVLIFFIAVLLYLLRFERVDNLGAYRIPPETRLLIPSGYNNHDSRPRISICTVNDRSRNLRSMNDAMAFREFPEYWFGRMKSAVSFGSGLKKNAHPL